MFRETKYFEKKYLSMNFEDQSDGRIDINRGEFDREIEDLFLYKSEFKPLQAINSRLIDKYIKYVESS